MQRCRAIMPKKKILVADDDKSMISLYSKLLPQAEYSVSSAMTFAEAARLLGEEVYDLLITDYMFPDGVGTDLAHLFSRSGGCGRVLMVSGTPFSREGLDCGCLFIEKPFKVEELLEAVRKALA